MSYNTPTDLTDYATARGVTLAGDPGVLLTKAHDWIERQRWAGHRTEPAQTTCWPRTMTGIRDDAGQSLDPLTVPQDIKTAELMAALIFDAGGDPQGAIVRTVKRQKVDVIETEWADNSAAVTLYPALTATVSRYFAPGQGVGGFGVSRG